MRFSTTYYKEQTEFNSNVVVILGFSWTQKTIKKIAQIFIHLICALSTALSSHHIRPGDSSPTSLSVFSSLTCLDKWFFLKLRLGGLSFLEAVSSTRDGEHVALRLDRTDSSPPPLFLLLLAVTENSSDDQLLLLLLLFAALMRLDLFGAVFARPNGHASS